MKIVRDIPYAEDFPLQNLDVFMPEGKADKVFLYFHGGGLERGSKASGDRFADYLTERGIAVVSANYRMYPDAKYPDFLVDAALAVKWTKNFIKETYTEAELYVGGSSAGGYMSMMLCFDERYLSSVVLSNDDISGYFHDAGQPTAHFRVLMERGIDDRRIIIDDSAPLYHVGRAPAYPRMRFIVSDNDMENRFEQTMLTLSTMKHFRYTGFDHVIMRDSKHCSYCGKRDENGESVFGKMIYEFISGN